MHIFVSDVHMTDMEAGGSVSDGQLQSFIDRVLPIVGEDKAEPVKLVFVGDVFDLLRSSKWSTLWKDKRSAPWSGMSQNFSHFKKSFAEQYAVQILNSICSRYAGFSKKLQALVAAKKLETVYLPGNHDYMVQLSSELRKLVVNFLALSDNPQKPFKNVYQNKAASVRAVHGNSFEPVNWHRESEGYWAMGDAVVLRIVNCFPEEACAEIGQNLEGNIGQALQEIDNVEPLVDLPIFVRWLTEQNLTIRASRDKVLKAWKRVVEEFLDIDEFRDRKGYGAKDYRLVRTAFELSTKLGVVSLISELASQFPNAGIDYRLAAEKEARINPDYRFVVFGHTHKPMLQPLAFSAEERNYFYVNTGCWRRLVTRTAGQRATSFGERRVATHFVVDEATEEDTQERYHLFQEWHTT
jgi:UDP-2,3-diacylglucosamine pyrophosphatase LpxH